jgi:hypothetical protein
MAGRPVLLASTLAPSRDDKTPEADLRALGIALGWAEGHGACGGLRPAADRLVCPCLELGFVVTTPVTETGVAA